MEKTTKRKKEKKNENGTMLEKCLLTRKRSLEFFKVKKNEIKKPLKRMLRVKKTGVLNSPPPLFFAACVLFNT